MSDQYGKALSFGPFELSVGNRLLTNGAKVVPLGSRAMDLLIILTEQANKVVGRRTLIERVWPERGAEQVSLRVHISALRKALDRCDPGRRYIANIPGRGYSFVVPVASRALQAPENPKPSPRPRVPARLMRMLGRGSAVAEIQTKLAEQKFVTIVGPGGVGKTTVAVAVAHELGQAFDGQVLFVDLSSLGNASLVAPALATSLGLSVQTNNVVPALVDRLQERPTLIILDCCEQLVDGASTVAEELIRRVPTLRMLATSREAMRVEGEHVYELDGLECPPDDACLSAREAVSYPSIQLLVERVRAVRSDFELTDADASTAARICRRLDGIPLAIELAACRVDVLGLGRTASLLDERLNLSWVGRRTAPPRHQTLNAALEWSYDLLGQAEKRVLSRLSVFAGGFTFEAAVAVVADESVDEADVSDCIWELRSKSMIATQGKGRLRLLDTTRAFALQRLAKEDEQDLFRRRHALYFADLFRQGAAIGASGWPRALGIEVDNLRAALSWAFSAAGEARIGVELAAASASTWMGMALLTECVEWMRKAIGHLDDTNSGTRQEMVLQSALASCVLFTGGMTEQSYATWAKALLLAEDLEDTEHQLDALLVLWAHELRVPDYEEAIKLADRCGEVSDGTGRIGAVATANYMRGITYYHAGRVEEAQSLLELSLHRDDEASRQLLIKRFGYDRKVDNLAGLATLAWLRGSPDQARRFNKMAIAEARQSNRAVNLCGALTFASLGAYLTNPLDGEAEALVDELAGHAGKYSLQNYQGFCLGMQALYKVRQGGDVSAAAAMLYAGLEKLSAVRYGIFDWFLQAEFAMCMALANRPREGLGAFERAGIDLGESRWYGPELHRIRGELALSNGEGLSVGRQYFLRALELANEQASLSWALRAATSLAIAEKSVGRKEAAWRTLQATHAKFREGFETADLRLAEQVLNGSHRRDGPANSMW
ncbi:winged helix-turn-helix domain-containing protein [Bradyrhizobium sp. C-145]|uniref:ATP-binding protein n=1 Tax=Bradyrhizobium sp. C-145 TaxID=574727 RepID=UPI00201B4744|nr:winged helix-turn-helix domain-containing protein [Bradyrhizobium sp. C-145]UQR63170.1 winged helix-turn-helix domain-containing protein [Bradyrhizobium sp. C-145]